MSIESQFKSMPKPKEETFCVQSIASECDSGGIFLPGGQYVDPIVLNEILEVKNSFPFNTDGEMEVWTTNPDLKARSESECICYVDQQMLKGCGCSSLFAYLTQDEYEFCTNWDSQRLSVTWTDGNQEDVEKAIADYLDAAPSQADIDEYKRLKSRLGL